MSSQRILCLGISQDFSGVEACVAGFLRQPLEKVALVVQQFQKWMHSAVERLWLREGDKRLISVLLNKPGTLPCAYMSTLGARVGPALMTKFTALFSCFMEWTQKRCKFHIFKSLNISQLHIFVLNWSDPLCYYSVTQSACMATHRWHMLNYAGVGLLLQLAQAIYPINIMRMNQRVVMFLMVCNGMSADSVIAPALLTFFITRWQRPWPTTIFNRCRGNHLRPILLDSL